MGIIILITIEWVYRNHEETYRLSNDKQIIRWIIYIVLCLWRIGFLRSDQTFKCSQILYKKPGKKSKIYCTEVKK